MKILAKLFSSRLKLKKISFRHSMILVSLFVILPSFILSNFLLEHPSPKNEIYTVVISKGDFSPKELTIKKNSQVIFVNKDTESHWIASNDHPLHQLYPEFDIKHPLFPTQSWKFTFDKVGVWPYHDHLNPQSMGTIVVTN